MSIPTNSNPWLQAPEGAPSADLVGHAETHAVPGQPFLSAVLHHIDWQLNRGNGGELRRVLFDPEVMPAILQSQHAPLIARVCAATGYLMEDDARHIAQQVFQSDQARATLMASLDPWVLGTANYATRFLPSGASAESLVRELTSPARASAESLVRELTSPARRAALADHGAGSAIGDALTAVFLHLPPDDRSEVAVRRLLTPRALGELAPVDKVAAAHAVIRHLPPGEATLSMLQNVLASRGDLSLLTATMEIAAASRDPERAQITDSLYTPEAFAALGRAGEFFQLAQGCDAISMLPAARRDLAAQALLTPRACEVLLTGGMPVHGGTRSVNLGGLSTLLRASEHLSEDNRRALMPAVLTPERLGMFATPSMQPADLAALRAAVGYLPAEDQPAWRRKLDGPFSAAGKTWGQVLQEKDASRYASAQQEGRGRGGPSP